MSGNLYVAAAIGAVALVTWLTRALPHMLLGGRRELPDWSRYLGGVIPPAIMVILVLYCLRGIELTVWPHGAAELIALGVVVLLQLLKKNTVLSIFLGTACYMILLRTAFAA